MDAGTFGTMGVGCGFAIAAALLEQQKLPSQQAPVVCIQGDSAFGFSGMEVETAHRYLFTYACSKLQLIGNELCYTHNNNYNYGSPLFTRGA